MSFSNSLKILIQFAVQFLYNCLHTLSIEGKMEEMDSGTVFHRQPTFLDIASIVLSGIVQALY